MFHVEKNMFHALGGFFVEYCNIIIVERDDIIRYIACGTTITLC